MNAQARLAKIIAQIEEMGLHTDHCSLCPRSAPGSIGGLVCWEKPERCPECGSPLGSTSETTVTILVRKHKPD